MHQRAGLAAIRMREIYRADRKAPESEGGMVFIAPCPEAKACMYACDSMGRPCG